MEVITNFLRNCLSNHPLLDSPQGARRFRLIVVIVVAMIVVVGMKAGVPATTALLTISGVVVAAAVITRFVLKGITPAETATA
ncbi:hypothetical protein [Actinoplanes subglobosus]|uniref:Uncharacterized protein n=1 Tax=Actinoplanes subglobosus TaxID=1547892 RepID=A0ABV8IV87_9ACTN